MFCLSSCSLALFDEGIDQYDATMKRCETSCLVFQTNSFEDTRECLSSCTVANYYYNSNQVCDVKCPTGQKAEASGKCVDLCTSTKYWVDVSKV